MFPSGCVDSSDSLRFVSAGAANGANGATNSVKAAAIPPTSPAATANSSSALAVKTVTLPATPVMKVSRTQELKEKLICELDEPTCLPASAAAAALDASSGCRAGREGLQSLARGPNAVFQLILSGL